MQSKLTIDPRDYNSVWTDKDRTSLRGALKNAYRSWFGETFLKRFPPLPEPGHPYYLHIGCGDNFLPHFVNADFYVTRIGSKKRKPDWMVDFRHRLKCNDNTFDGIFSEHVLEHFSPNLALHVLKECLRLLKPGGTLRLIVPDAMAFVKAYLGQVPDDEMPMLYDMKADYLSCLAQKSEHQSVWDDENLAAVLECAGFVNVAKQSFRQGRDPGLLVDAEKRRKASLVIEAQKPS